MALKAVCVMKGDGATQGVINLCQEVMYASQLRWTEGGACTLVRRVTIFQVDFYLVA